MTSACPRQCIATYAAPVCGDHPVHVVVGQPARDVVDQAGAARDGLAGDHRAGGVDADDGAARDQAVDHREHAVQLVLHRHAPRARTRGLAADVEQVRALGQQLQPVRDRRGRA